MAGRKLSGARKRGRSKANKRAREAAEAAAVTGTSMASAYGETEGVLASPAEMEQVVGGAEAEEEGTGEEGAEEEQAIQEENRTITSSSAPPPEQELVSGLPQNVMNGVLRQMVCRGRPDVVPRHLKGSNDPSSSRKWGDMSDASRPLSPATTHATNDTGDSNQASGHSNDHDRGCGSPLADELLEMGEHEAQEDHGAKDGRLTACNSTYSVPTEAGEYDPEVEGQAFPSPPLSGPTSPSPPPPYTLDGGQHVQVEGFTDHYVQQLGAQGVQHYGQQFGHVQAPVGFDSYGMQQAPPYAPPPYAPLPYGPVSQPQPGMYNGQHNGQVIYDCNYNYYNNVPQAPPPMHYGPYAPPPPSWQPPHYAAQPPIMMHANGHMMNNQHYSNYNSHHAGASMPQSCYGSYASPAAPPHSPPHGFTGTHPPHTSNYTNGYHTPHTYYNNNNSNYGDGSASLCAGPSQWHAPPQAFHQHDTATHPHPPQHMPPQPMAQQGMTPAGYEVLPCLDRVSSIEPYGDTACAFDPRNGELITFYRMEGYTGPMVFETNYVHTKQGSFRKADFYAGRVPPLCPSSSSSACGADVGSGRKGSGHRKTRGGKGKARHANYYEHNMPVAA